MPLSKVVLVVGASGVGKTTLVNRATDGDFVPEEKPTVGLHKFEGKVVLDPIQDRARLPLETRQVLPPDGLELEFWEIGGRERCRQLPRGKQPDGILLCYSVHDRASFHSIAHMLMHYRMERHLAFEHSSLVADVAKAPRLVGVLCGTQADDTGACAVSTSESTEFSKSNGIHLSVVTSARTGEGVNIAMYALAQALMEADEEAEAECAVDFDAPRPEELWALATSTKEATQSGLTDPRGLRPHEPRRGGVPVQDLVEVFAAPGESSYTARPLGTCLELGLLHRAVHVWLCDLTTGAMLLRKYSVHSRKNASRWGPSCHAEVRCYDPETGAGPQGGPPASEGSIAAASRALKEQLGIKKEPRIQDLWFSCASRDGNCREHIDVFVIPVENGVLPTLDLRVDELVQWVHFTDVFGFEGASVRTLGHFEPAYRSTMIQRMQVRIVHSYHSQNTSIKNFGGS